MIKTEPRIVLDDYRGINFWGIHSPLLGANIISKTKWTMNPMWRNGYVLGVL